MAWLLLNMWLVHGIDIVISAYEIYSMLIACYGLVLGIDIVTNTYEIHEIHVTYYWVSVYKYRCY